MAATGAYIWVWNRMLANGRWGLARLDVEAATLVGL